MIHKVVGDTSQDFATFLCWLNPFRNVSLIVAGVAVRQEMCFSTILFLVQVNNVVYRSNAFYYRYNLTNTEFSGWELNETCHIHVNVCVFVMLSTPSLLVSLPSCNLAIWRENSIPVGIDLTDISTGFDLFD